MDPFATFSTCAACAAVSADTRSSAAATGAAVASATRRRWGSHPDIAILRRAAVGPIAALTASRDQRALTLHDQGGALRQQDRRTSDAAASRVRALHGERLALIDDEVHLRALRDANPVAGAVGIDGNVAGHMVYATLHLVQIRSDYCLAGRNVAVVLRREGLRLQVRRPGGELVVGEGERRRARAHRRHERECRDVRDLGAEPGPLPSLAVFRVLAALPHRALPLPVPRGIAKCTIRFYHTFPQMKRGNGVPLTTVCPSPANRPLWLTGQYLAP